MLKELYERLYWELDDTIEMWSYLLLFYILAFFAMATILLTFEAWGLVNALLVAMFGLAPAFVLWKAQAHFLRGLRQGFFMLLILFLSLPVLGYVGSFLPTAGEIPVYSKLEFLAIGLFGETSAAMIAWETWKRISFVARAKLTRKDILNAFLKLPSENINDLRVQMAYVSLTRLCELFANREYTIVVEQIGAAIEQLLLSIYKGENPRVAPMATELQLNVSLDTVVDNEKETPFDVKYFWHRVRSKYAHTFGIEPIGSQRIKLFNVLIEPSEDITRKSIGLLSEFIKAYSKRCIMMATK